MITVGTINADGTVVTDREVNQSELTSECWLIQFHGTDACKTCEVKNTKECGGINIIRTGKNNRGISVPLGN